MQEGRLRRERLTLFFTRIIDTKVPVAGHRAVAEYFNALSRKESLALCEFGMGAPGQAFSGLSDHSNARSGSLSLLLPISEYQPAVDRD
jgi:hypothetical protein